MGGEIESQESEKDSKNGKNNLFKYGINRIKNKKKTFEVFNIDNTINLTPEKLINIFGIFDGHSGNEIAQYLSENFCNELSKNANFKIENYEKALIETFIDLDKSLRKEEINNLLIEYSQNNKLKLKEKLDELYKDNKDELNEDDLFGINTFMDIINPENLEDVLISDYVGSSGLIILINENNTYIANAGNSHFIIINKQLDINNKIIEKQKNQKEQEIKRSRIEKGIKYGKEIKGKDYLYTRGFGDYQYKNNNSIDIETQEILSEPFIYEIKNKDIKYIIAFNNALFEILINTNDSDKNINNIYKKISGYFIEQLKDEQKLISDIISQYFDNIIQNYKNNINGKGIKNNESFTNNLSCIFIEFFS